MARPRLRRHRVSALATALTLAACAPGPERLFGPRTSHKPAPRGAALLRSTMVAAHNAARARVGVPPLDWSDALAASAEAYADGLARSGRFEHADQPQGPGRQGENLWMGTRGAYPYREMVGHWVAERDRFVNGPVPAISRTGRWQDVGHYTQIVWRGTSAVGCALASNGRDDYLVCRYAPVGNAAGVRAL